MIVDLCLKHRLISAEPPSLNDIDHEGKTVNELVLECRREFLASLLFSLRCMDALRMNDSSVKLPASGL